MVKDPERVDQPEGTYRDALNANLYYQKGAIVNEQGTVAFTNVGGFKIDNVIGSCSLKDGRIVLFFNYTFNNSPTSAISVIEPATKQNTIIYRNSELNFKPSNTIEATSKIDVSNNVLVYFTDNYMQKAVNPQTGIEYITEYNPPRVINITRQLSSPVTELYNNSDYTVQKLDIFMNAGYIPEFRNVRIEEGGGVVSGTYHLALAYVDEDLNRTNYLVTSNPVHLVAEHEDAIPTETITGDPQGSQSNKSIIWEIDIPIPSNYTHVRPVVIQRFGGGYSQESSEFAYELEIVKIPDTENNYANLEITYTGLEQVASSTISEIVIDSVRYETAKSFVQLDNRLYVSNLRARGDIGYQRFANNIRISPVATEVPKFDPKRIHTIVLNDGYSQYSGGTFSNDFNRYKALQENNLSDGFFASNVRKGYKDVRMSYKYRGYRRSEVYAFYISFVLKDGTETYAYHIPGREAKKIIKIDEYENAPINVQGVANALQDGYNLNVQEFRDLYPDAKLHQITDTQYLISTTSSDMSYWENENEVYPNTEDFEVWTADDEGLPLYTQYDLKNKKVRHHKMPPNKNLNFSFIDELDENQTSPALFGANTAYDGLVLKENIKILGVQFTNIPIPEFIKNQVQGFKIYYAKRTQPEKTVIGQSVVLPSWYEPTIAFTNRMTTAAHGPYADAWFLKGMIPPYFKYYPIITNDIGGSRKTRAISTFTFHDFNMLKNKHTLSGASHIDVQKILTMRMWAGGNKKRPGDDARYMLDSDWVNSDISNTEWYEWVDTEGDEVYTNEQPAEFQGVSNYWTSILVAQRYHNPNYVNTSSTYWSTDYNNAANSIYANYFLNNYQTLLTIDTNSKTYITGSTQLKNTDSSAFSNVDYLMHFAGESCMLFGLSSGLPMLIEHVSFLPEQVLSNVGWFYYANWSTATGEEDDENPRLAELNSPNPDKEDYQSWPTLYLVNLCSYKTNVYKPFDQQRLVWTGYYQPIDLNDDRAAGFKTEENDYIYATNVVFGGDTYVGRYSFRATSQDYGSCFNLDGGDKSNSNNWYSHGFGPYKISADENKRPYDYRAVDPYATVFNFFCESDDLLGFRHQGDNSEGVTVSESMFFDASIGADVLFNGPEKDNTHNEHLLYMNNYSAVQDIKVTSPLPKKLFNPTFYPTRTIRSTVDDGSIQDKYRFFLALDYKDIPKNRGEITKIFTLGSILYLHTERSLFVTRGRQQLGLGDGTQAFVGSGDIFEQNPDEVLSTTEGYGGTDCQFASLTTRFGQFFVNRKDKKVYMMAEGLEEASSNGMERWFLENIPYTIESYINLENVANFDSPTEYFGFTAAYDPKYKRIILSKRELKPTQVLINYMSQGLSNVVPTANGFSFYSFRAGITINVDFESDYFKQSGWTVSYYPELKVWGSRHNYLPVIFANNQKEYYSLTNEGIANVWEHSDFNNPGNYYDTQFNFEFEFIDNTETGASKVFSNIRYWADVVSLDTSNTYMLDKHTSPGFEQFYVYNTTQISETKDIYYLNNARLVDRWWYINDFRDMSKQIFNTSDVLANEMLNVQNQFNTGTTTSLETISMFTEEGKPNSNYINLNKSWYDQKRFVDHFLGVRLISNNSTKNLIYLYSAGTKFRQSFR